MPRREYQPYFIPRRANRCQECRELFAPGTNYYSSLLETVEKAVQRADFCALCWKPENHPRDLFWQGKTPNAAAAIVNDAERCEKALELLRSYATSDDLTEKSQAYVLVLFLERRKQVALRKELWEGSLVAALLYEVLESGEMLVVPKIALDQIDIEKIQSLVAEQLGLQNEKAK